jgi:hypothetical protein
METVVDLDGVFYYVLEGVRLVYPCQFILDKVLESDIILVN